MGNDAVDVAAPMNRLTAIGAFFMTGKIAADNVRLKRAYEPPGPQDGTRILVDRLWPRGLSKEAAALGQWMRDVAPSTELRKWFGHDPARWEEFRSRYRDELHQNRELINELRDLARKGRITLVYAARDEIHNDAIELRDLILGN
jgi:uncharacterized protein YeaO (DUF488 family)